MSTRHRIAIAPSSASTDEGADAQAASATAGAGRSTARYGTITCPECHAATRACMPVDACQHFWECPACGALLHPKPGDCCVFCSYGDVPCPSAPARRAHHA